MGQVTVADSDSAGDDAFVWFWDDCLVVVFALVLVLWAGTSSSDGFEAAFVGFESSGVAEVAFAGTLDAGAVEFAAFDEVFSFCTTAV